MKPVISGQIYFRSLEHRGVDEFNTGGAVRQNCAPALVYVGRVSEVPIVVD